MTKSPRIEFRRRLNELYTYGARAGYTSLRRRPSLRREIAATVAAAASASVTAVGTSVIRPVRPSTSTTRYATTTT